MSSRVADAYTVLLREKKLPLQVGRLSACPSDITCTAPTRMFDALLQLLEDPEQKTKGKKVGSDLSYTSKSPLQPLPHSTPFQALQVLS
jgi:hypothetical protein